MAWLGISRSLRFAASIRHPTTGTFETRRTTLSIRQSFQRLTRSVLNPEVISFGENGPQRESNGLGHHKAGQQVWDEKPSFIGLSRPPPRRERLFAQEAVAEGKDLASNGLCVAVREAASPRPAQFSPPCPRASADRSVAPSSHGYRAPTIRFAPAAPGPPCPSRRLGCSAQFIAAPYPVLTPATEAVRKIVPGHRTKPLAGTAQRSRPIEHPPAMLARNRARL